MNKRVAVIGGGLAGLSAAFDLSRSGTAFDLFETSDRFGGMIHTTVRDGFLIEHGAESWIAQKPALDELARDLGIAEDIIASPAISPSTSILRNGELLPLPAGMRLFVPTDLAAAEASQLFSRETKQQLRDEIAFWPAEVSDDESIAAFVERHFGRELLDVVAAPLLAGVYGGDAKKLSARAVVPGIVALEERYGSLIRGTQIEHPRPSSRGVFRTFRSGMQSLIDSLVGHLPKSSLHLRSTVEGVTASAGQYQLHLSDGVHDGFTDVVLAVPLPVVVHLLEIDLPTVEYSSAATVALAFDELPQLPRGFGFLSATGEPSRVMAATFVHQKWPHRVTQGHALLRAFVSSPEVLRSSNDEIIAAVIDDFRRVLGIKREPLFAAVDRWEASMPQYHVGHAAKIAKVHRRIAAIGSRIQLAGNWLDGVGMPDAVRTGRAAAASVIHYKNE